VAHASVNLSHRPSRLTSSGETAKPSDDAVLTADATQDDVDDAAGMAEPWLSIPADAQTVLDAYWAANDGSRVTEAQEHGYDPVDQPQQFWNEELTEPAHKDVAAVVRDTGVFTKPLVEKWVGQEDDEKLTGEEAAASEEFAALLELARTPLEYPSHARVTAAGAPVVEGWAGAVEALALANRATADAMAFVAAHEEGRSNEFALEALSVLKTFAANPTVPPQLGDVHTHVHMPAHDLSVHVDTPDVESHFHAAEQEPPTVNVTVPEQTAPDVHVHVPETAAAKPASIVVNVPAPQVDVHVPEAAPRTVRVEYAADGSKRFVTETETSVA